MLKSYNNCIVCGSYIYSVDDEYNRISNILVGVSSKCSICSKCWVYAINERDESSIIYGTFMAWSIKQVLYYHNKIQNSISLDDYCIEDSTYMQKRLQKKIKDSFKMNRHYANNIINFIRKHALGWTIKALSLEPKIESFIAKGKVPKSFYMDIGFSKKMIDNLYCGYLEYPENLHIKIEKLYHKG